jgi:2-keto-3-deoxy-6-phosphogluconate aldolase
VVSSSTGGAGGEALLGASTAQDESTIAMATAQGASFMFSPFATLLSQAELNVCGVSMIQE